MVTAVWRLCSSVATIEPALLLGALDRPPMLPDAPPLRLAPELITPAAWAMPVAAISPIWIAPSGFALAAAAAARAGDDGSPGISCDASASIDASAVLCATLAIATALLRTMDATAAAFDFPAN